MFAKVISRRHLPLVGKAFLILLAVLDALGDCVIARISVIAFAALSSNILHKVPLTMYDEERHAIFIT